MPKVLSQLVQQYHQRHQRLPEEIVVHPVALAALTLKQSMAPRWQGIPVKCREIKLESAKDGKSLGIIVLEGALRSFDL